MGDEDQRLSRIENKVDVLTEAIGKFAVVEARLTDFLSTNSRLSARIADIENKQSDLNTRVQVQDVQLQGLVSTSRALALGVAAALLSGVLKVIGIV